MNPSNEQVRSTLIAPSAAVTTSTSATFDMDDARYATVNIQLSTEANTDNTGVVLSIRESDDTVLTNAATMVADVTIDNTAARKHLIHIDNSGRKRHKFLVVTPDTTTNGAVIVTADVTKTRVAIGPASTSDMVESTNDTVTVI